MKTKKRPYGSPLIRNFGADVKFLVVKKFPRNTIGRDFVVGDIHGAFDSVILRMKQVGFDAQKDRLFSVGDLVDRGLDSPRVIKFLSMPYVHAVRGNHDDGFCSLTLDEIKILTSMNYNGMGWAKDATDETISDIRLSLQRLPVAIEIETDRGLVGLVHADVPQGMSWGDFTELLSSGDEETRQTALWGRSRINNIDTTGVAGIDRLFVGHSIQWNGPKRLGNVYFIDSGAIFREMDGDRGFLTMANIACCSMAITCLDSTWQERGVYAQPGNGPFGKYVAVESPPKTDH